MTYICWSAQRNVLHTLIFMPNAQKCVCLYWSQPRMSWYILVNNKILSDLDAIVPLPIIFLVSLFVISPYSFARTWHENWYVYPLVTRSRSHDSLFQLNELWTPWTTSWSKVVPWGWCGLRETLLSVNPALGTCSSRTWISPSITSRSTILSPSSATFCHAR